MSRKVLIRNLEDERTERSVFVGGVEIKLGREAEFDVARFDTIGSRPSFRFAEPADEHARRNAEQRAIALQQLGMQEQQGTPETDADPANPNVLPTAVEGIWQSREYLDALTMAELREIGAPYEINGRSKAAIIEAIVAWQETNATVAAGGE
jgi:hypothetical protein